ncbi:GDSL-type esterase/lipase family protein [Paucilactobacillus hokkaidonensis]|uniref:GDSL-type esterase/lipase family protein n=1 Tax=Paucilactobacillus hokkaidonensis TaxID=1193095 RepID=UPI0006D29BD5|nr:GDSL-type esterase/lipase family protein [Paucilactobacillus hokkaidonensis]
MNNDIKVRFKMYKKGCQWLTCILTLAGVTMFSVATGNADTMDQANDSNNIGVQKNINSSSVNLENAGSDSANYVSSAPTQTKAATVNNTSTALADSTDKASSPAVANDQNKSQDDFTQDNYVAMGDSITQGWDGQETVATPYPEKVSQILSFNSVNGSSYAIGGAHIDGNASSDFTQRVNDLITDPELNSYDIVSIDYGINDLNYGNNSLIDIQNAMIDGINKIISANGNIKIYGILPIASYNWEVRIILERVGFRKMTY